MHLAVAGDVIVITDVFVAEPLVVGLALPERVLLGGAGGAAVQHDKCYGAHDGDFLKIKYKILTIRNLEPRITRIYTNPTCSHQLILTDFTNFAMASRRRAAHGDLFLPQIYADYADSFANFQLREEA